MQLCWKISTKSCFVGKFSQKIALLENFYNNSLCWTIYTELCFFGEKKNTLICLLQKFPQKFTLCLRPEHMVVAMVDRILSHLDKNSTCSAVIKTGADWDSAFDRGDPTIIIQKLLAMDLRSSLVLACGIFGSGDKFVCPQGFLGRSALYLM